MRPARWACKARAAAPGQQGGLPCVVPIVIPSSVSCSASERVICAARRLGRNKRCGVISGAPGSERASFVRRRSGAWWLTSSRPPHRSRWKSTGLTISAAPRRMRAVKANFAGSGFACFACRLSWWRKMSLGRSNSCAKRCAPRRERCSLETDVPAPSFARRWGDRTRGCQGAKRRAPRGVAPEDSITFERVGSPDHEQMFACPCA